MIFSALAINSCWRQDGIAQIIRCQRFYTVSLSILNSLSSFLISSTIRPTMTPLISNFKLQTSNFKLNFKPKPLVVIIVLTKPVRPFSNNFDFQFSVQSPVQVDAVQTSSGIFFSNWLIFEFSNFLKFEPKNQSDPTMLEQGTHAMPSRAVNACECCIYPRLV
jgi:hypothetical protein